MKTLTNFKQNMGIKLPIFHTNKNVYDLQDIYNDFDKKGQNSNQNTPHYLRKTLTKASTKHS